MNEETRIKTLRALEVLDTPPNPQLDRITQLASTIFKAPISVVSLVDEDRLWFKSKVGLDAPETPRAGMFCDYAIKANADVFEVPNSTEDDRFKDNPMVVGPPNIRYYAGVPLTARNRAKLGTLCIIDSKPREPMSAGKRLLLKELGKQAMREIELARLNIDVSQLDKILPLASD